MSISIEKIKSGNREWYFLRDEQDGSVLDEPTRYLMHKSRQHCSPNTVKAIAYALSYYLIYMQEKDVTLKEVLDMGYADQERHFTDFLQWLLGGNHSKRDKCPDNNTCNSYLGKVFGFYQFLIMEYDRDGDLIVLEESSMSYTDKAGVKRSRRIKTFSGHLPPEKSSGKCATEEEILKVLEASENMRNNLLILICEETGLRIGEALGIRYVKDIDYDTRTITVTYREDNENNARAKNAEVRRVKISKETYEILMCYMAENRELLAKTEYLFVTLHGKTRGEPLKNGAVYSSLRAIEKKTGVKITPHMLRHYFADERRREGWTIEQISKALGHKNLSTTERYLHISEDELAEVMEKYFEETKGLYDIKKQL